MTARSIAVVTAGLSQPSSPRLLADRLAAATRAALGPETTVEVIELREVAVDVTNNMLTGFPSPRLREAIDTVTRADGLIAVTPVFTASYSGLFKSFFDGLDKEALDGKPALLAATGGTERHSCWTSPASRLPSRHAGGDGCVRGFVGLGQRRRDGCVAAACRARGGRAGGAGRGGTRGRD